MSDIDEDDGTLCNTLPALGDEVAASRRGGSCETSRSETFSSESGSAPLTPTSRSRKSELNQFAFTEDQYDAQSRLVTRNEKSNSDLMLQRFVTK